MSDEVFEVGGYVQLVNDIMSFTASEQGRVYKLLRHEKDEHRYTFRKVHKRTGELLTVRDETMLQVDSQQFNDAGAFTDTRDGATIPVFDRVDADDVTDQRTEGERIVEAMMADD